MPRIDDLLDRLKTGKWISTLDLAWGYWQLPVHPDSIEKTAFVTPDGHYEWLRMPFGLTNGPPVYQRLMNSLFEPLKDDQTFAYLDDVMIAAPTPEENLAKLRRTFDVLRRAGLTMRLQKCSFLQTKVHYLGHDIENGELKPGMQKMPAIEKFPQPKNVHQVRQFLGLTGYFRKFIKNYSIIAAPISKLTRKDVPFYWGPEQTQAANTLKEALLKQPVLAIYNPQAETELHTDASAEGIGAILLQKQSDGKLKPVLYFSMKTTPQESKYHSYELETLAIVRALQRMRVYLYGRPFKIYTDCAALRYTLTKKDLNPKIARWWLLIQEFEFEILYRPGTKMQHVDCLSRAAVDLPQARDLETAADQIPVKIRRVDIKLSDWISVIQQEDPHCKSLLSIWNSGTKREKEIIKKEYRISQNRIYRRTTQGPRWVVPKQCRSQVVRMMHDEQAHPGIDITLDSLQKYVWFPKMKKYVEDYLRACLQCQYIKPHRAKAGERFIPSKPTTPMDTLHLDHLGPLPTTPRRNTHILVTIDSFTKYVWLFPTKQTGSQAVIKNMESIFQTYGTPRRIIADRGRAFDCEAFKKFCKRLGITLILTAVATPRANGQVERINAVIINRLMAISPNENEWDKNIHTVKMCINNSKSQATGKTPNELLLGNTPKLATNSFFLNAIQDIQVPDEVNIFDNKRQLVRQEAVQSNSDAQDRVRARFSDRQPAIKFQVGDYVLLPNNLPGTKLKNKNKGSYVITKVLPYDRYLIENAGVRNRKYKSVHSAEHLRKITGTIEK